MPITEKDIDDTITALVKQGYLVELEQGVIVLPSALPMPPMGEQHLVTPTEYARLIDACYLGQGFTHHDMIAVREAIETEMFDDDGMPLVHYDAGMYDAIREDIDKVAAHFTTNGL
jgi:hypothetical protein